MYLNRCYYDEQWFEWIRQNCQIKGTEHTMGGIMYNGDEAEKWLSDWEEAVREKLRLKDDDIFYIYATRALSLALKRMSQRYLDAKPTV